ncbi:exo-beta-1,3-glucanase (GH17 family) [Dongia mobilis]|uniref:Endo-1,3-beta-glucanase btgC n=2 Tax=Dongia mobilis TaxID=578943 RepID=A0A4R6WIX7_9PROT|nr:exo-beta-1,3-glucanase (GH17 family) [Dongia mobilis]
MPMPLRWLVALAVAAALGIGFWAWIGRGIDLPPAPSPKLACLSYTPFQGAQTPYDPSLVIPPEQIAADLDRLQPVTDCIRIYATDQGIDATVPLAAERGMQVLLGIWVGSDAALYEKQIARAIELAQAHPAAIKAIIVGNEVLLRGEQSGETLAELVLRVKAATGLPTTYADVWGFWQKAPQALVDAVDFLTIHLLPYWEDDPAPAEAAIQHLDFVLETMQAQFPGKALMVGETGWPSAGRAREDAVPSLTEQAKYLRLFMRDVDARGIDYNIIEAFDQPWKRHQEGAVGGYWGVFDGARMAKFDWTGPVSNHPDWPWKAGLSLLIGLACLGLARFRLPSSSPLAGEGFASALLGAVLAGAGGSAIMLQLERAALIAVSRLDAAIEAALILQSLLVLTLALRGSAQLATAPLAAATDWLRAPRRRAAPLALVALLRALVLGGAALVALALCFDGRYRGFPLATYGLPAILFLVLQCRAGRLLGAIADGREERLLSAIFLGCALFLPWWEGFNNAEALAFAAILLAFALGLAGAWRRAPANPVIAGA